jgi:hypothetical protein
VSPLLPFNGKGSNGSNWAGQLQVGGSRVAPGPDTEGGPKAVTRIRGRLFATPNCHIAAAMSSKDSLLPKKETNWRNHYVNGTPFTIAMATFALVAAGSIVCGAVMLVSGRSTHGVCDTTIFL